MSTIINDPHAGAEKRDKRLLGDGWTGDPEKMARQWRVKLQLECKYENLTFRPPDRTENKCYIRAGARNVAGPERNDGLAASFDFEFERGKRGEWRLNKYSFSLLAADGQTPSGFRYDFDPAAAINCMDHPVCHLTPVGVINLRLPVGFLHPDELLAQFLHMPPWW